MMASIDNPGGGSSDDTSGPMKPPELLLDTMENIPEGDVLWEGEEDALYLFAFDHLMDQSYIARFVKGLRPAKLVWLPHHKLAWPFYFPPQSTAVPTIQRTNDAADRVWGILYQANRIDLSKLEGHLRVPNRYYRKSVIVRDRGGRRFRCFCYALNHDTTESHQPSAAYIERLAVAAESRGLPVEWLKQLRSLAPAD